MNVVEEIFVDSDQTIRVTGLEDQSGQPITTAIITATFTDKDNNQVAQIKLDNVQEGLNDFIGQIPADTLQSGKRYQVDIHIETLSGSIDKSDCLKGVDHSCFT